MLDVAVSTRSGWLYAWRTGADANSACVERESFRHDDRNTGNYGTPLAHRRCASAGPGPDGGAGGDGGCRVGGANLASGGSSLPLLAVVTAILLARRPRCPLRKPRT